MENTPFIETASGRIVPTKIAQRCPVCNGFGTLKFGAKTCQACNGLGYILVPAGMMEDRQNGESYGNDR